MGPMLHCLPGPSPKPHCEAYPQQVLMSEVLLHHVLLLGGFPGSLQKFCKTLCVGVCTSVTGSCWKGAFLECLLTFASVSIIHRPRTSIHQAAFCSRNVATSSARMDSSSRWFPGMSLPGAASREYRTCSSMLKAQELPERCQELVAEPQA